MGHLKDISNQQEQQTFPGATFEIAEDVPQSQCSEAKIEADDGIIRIATGAVEDPGKFVGWNLIGKKVTIVKPIVEAGTYDIIFNNDDIIATFANWTLTDFNVEYYVHNGGSLILTRNLQSFGEFIKAAGFAYTIKSRKLYTNIPYDDLQPACTILFDPLT